MHMKKNMCLINKFIWLKHLLDQVSSLICILGFGYPIEIELMSLKQQTTNLK